MSCRRPIVVLDKSLELARHPTTDRTSLTGPSSIGRPNSSLGPSPKFLSSHLLTLDVCLRREILPVDTVVIETRREREDDTIAHQRSAAYQNSPADQHSAVFSKLGLVRLLALRGSIGSARGALANHAAHRRTSDGNSLQSVTIAGETVQYSLRFPENRSLSSARGLTHTVPSGLVREFHTTLCAGICRSEHSDIRHYCRRSAARRGSTRSGLRVATCDRS